MQGLPGGAAGYEGLANLQKRPKKNPDGEARIGMGKLFKPCFKGLHENCARVNVFDPLELCSCMCHGKD